jgi:LacI family transcriptional regulator
MILQDTQKRMQTYLTSCVNCCKLLISAGSAVLPLPVENIAGKWNRLEEAMVTIKQIAERAGVSTATVSNVIHGKTKKVSPENIKKIQTLIDEMGYVQRTGARVLSNEGSRLVAVIINYHHDYEDTVLTDPFYSRSIGYIEQQLHRLGYYMMFYSASDIDDVFKMVMTWDVDGVIALTFPRTDCEKLHSMIHKPVVSIDAHGDFVGVSQVPNVGLQDKEGGYLMTKYLFQSGYESLYVCISKDFGNDHFRWVGAQKAWMDCGAKAQGKKLQLISIGNSQNNREEYYKQILNQIPFRRKTALFCLSDYLAVEANSYLAEHGVKVPDQLGIAGYDDVLHASRFSVPRITTIHQDIQRKAELAVNELVALLQDPNHPIQDYRLPVSLVVRQST